MKTTASRRRRQVQGAAFTARRVVDELEKHGLVKGDKYDAVVAQRDGLRAALSFLVYQVEKEGLDMLPGLDGARAAIAKARGHE